MQTRNIICPAVARVSLCGHAANRGNGFVPFLQISDEAHKTEIDQPQPGARIKIFFETDAARPSPTGPSALRNTQ